MKPFVVRCLAFGGTSVLIVPATPCWRRCVFQWSLELLPSEQPAIRAAAATGKLAKPAALLEDEKQGDDDDDDDADSIDEELNARDVDLLRDVCCDQLFTHCSHVPCRLPVVTVAVRLLSWTLCGAFAAALCVLFYCPEFV